MRFAKRFVLKQLSTANVFSLRTGWLGLAGVGCTLSQPVDLIQKLIYSSRLKVFLLRSVGRNAIRF